MSLMIYFTYAAVYLTFPYLLYALRKPSDPVAAVRMGTRYIIVVDVKTGIGVACFVLF